MSEERFKEVFRRLTSETPDPPAFSDLETHRAKPTTPIRLKPWMAAVGAAALVLVVVGLFGLLGGGGPDLASPDENTIDYVKLEYSATVNPVCEGGEIVDNGGFDEATIEIWGPNGDDLTLMVATLPDGSTERTIAEGDPVTPDYIWVEGNPEDYPSNTRLRVVRCEGTGGPPGMFNAFSIGGLTALPFHMFGPPPGFETWSDALYPTPDPIPTEWNGNAVLLYENRNESGGGSTSFDLYVSEDDRRVVRFHAEQNLPGVGDAVVDYSVVEQDEVPADSVSFSKVGLTPISQGIAELGQEDCPVTIPSQAFVPPDTHPATPSDPSMVWFGKDELWTALSIDGISEGRKSVWWSSEFTDPGIESSPDITVTYTLLNSGTALTIINDQGTNASTPEDGLFIIAGSEPGIEGCWQVTAIYKDASLTYTYYNPDGLEVSPGTVPDVVGMTVNEARSVLETLTFQAAFHDSANPTYEVCAQEPGSGLEINPGAIIGMRTAPPGECEKLMSPTDPISCDRAPKFIEGPAVYFNCGDASEPGPKVVRSVEPDSQNSAAVIAQVFLELLQGPTSSELDAGFSSFFSEGSEDALLSIKGRAGEFTLNFTEDITVNNASTSAGSAFFLAELYANAFQFEEVESVEFQINGSCEAFWEFLQAGPVCNITDRAAWEQIQENW